MTFTSVATHQIFVAAICCSSQQLESTD